MGAGIAPGAHRRVCPGAAPAGAVGYGMIQLPRVPQVPISL